MARIRQPWEVDQPEEPLFGGGEEPLFGGGPAGAQPSQSPSVPTPDQWGNAPGSPQAGTDAFWNAVTNQKQTKFDPGQLSGWGVTQLSPDKYRLNTGQVVDIIGDIGGANIAGQWHIIGGQQGQNGQGVNWGSQPGSNVGGGAGTQGGGGSGGGFQPLDLGAMLGGGGGTGDDWMSKGLQDLFRSSMETVNKPVGSAQFESLRQPIDKARRTSMNQVRAGLADRGMLLGSGELANATGRIEERLAPEFASAVQRASVEGQQGARQTALGALQGGGQMKAIQGDLALRQLDQNRQWNQFLGDFGLRREQVQEMLSQGRVDQLLQYYDMWNRATQTSAGGLIDNG